MAGSAKVSSLEGLRDFRAAMVEFQELAKNSLGEVESDLQRTLSWLKSDREYYWATAIRKRANEVTQAKSDLYRKQMQGREGERPSCIDEKKALDAAERALKDAQERLEATKRWQRLLEREMTMYKGQVQQLSRALDGDIPLALAQMDRMLDSLDKYVRLAAPTLQEVEKGAARLKELEEEPPEVPEPKSATAVSEYAALRMNTPGRGVRDSLPIAASVSGAPGRPLAAEAIARLKQANPAIDPADEYDKILLAPGALSRRCWYAERLEFSAHGDSGWFIGACPCDPPGVKYESTAIFRVLERRRDLTELFSLPRGWLAVVEDGAVIAILDVKNREVRS